MSEAKGRAKIDAEAVEFMVRFQSDAATDADWAALTAWLEADPAHGEALDRLGSLDTLLATTLPPVALPFRAKSKPARSWIGWTWGVGIAAAATIGGALIFSQASPPARLKAPLPAGTTYVATAPKAVVLPDGSHVWMNRGSKLSYDGAGVTRAVSLEEGSQALFDVVHQNGHPFVIRVADRQVSVIGTAFDIDSRPSRLVVEVERGIVEVAGDQGSDLHRLTVGQRLEHQPGAETSAVTRIATGEIGAWRSGRLVYDHAPLSQVTSDLGRYFDKPIRLTPEARKLQFTGVLVLDRPQSMLMRLKAFMPIKADVLSHEILIDANIPR